MQSPKRIAVFQALFLGDFLCATPAINAVKRRFPEAEITMIGLPWAQELARRLDSVSWFEPFPGHPELPDREVDRAGVAPFYHRARQARYDLAIQMHGSGGVTNEIIAALGAKMAIGHGPASDPNLTAALLWREDEREVMRWLRLVGLIGADASDTRVDFPIGERDRDRADQLLRSVSASGPVIALHAGAKDPARRWPPACFAHLGDELARQHGARIVLTGSDGERSLTGEIARRMRAPALDLAGRTDLGALAAVIARLDLLVTNDTGASHVAAAMRTPSVVLFGLSRPSRWAPLDEARHTVVDARAFVRFDVDPREALGQLHIEPVLAACERKLDAATPAVLTTAARVA